MLNLTRLHLGIAHESQFQGLGLRRPAIQSSRALRNATGRRRLPTTSVCAVIIAGSGDRIDGRTHGHRHCDYYTIVEVMGADEASNRKARTEWPVALAPLVGANLEIMEADALRTRAKRPFVLPI